MALVLAAGQSARMGRPKQTLDVDGKPMLERVLDSLRRSKVERVVVVLGAHAAEVMREVRFKDEGVIVNPDFEKGMSSSLKAGLAAIKDEADAVLVVLGDQPFVSAKTVDALLGEYRATGAAVVVPVFHNRRGNPVLFDRRLFPQVMLVGGDRGARSIVEANEGTLREVAVEDAGVLADIDVPSDLKPVKRSRPMGPRKKRGKA